MSFVARREYPPSGRWYYAGECVEHIEEHNCAKGCAVPRPEDLHLGPGGCCPVLARVFLEEPAEELVDDGAVVTCTARIPTGG